MQLTLNQIKKIVGGRYQGDPGLLKKTIRDISINSKDINKNDLFIGIKGEKFDGDNFAEGAIKKGAIVAQIPQKFWDDELAGYATADKISLTKELEKLTLGMDSRVRVEESNYDDGWGEVAVATTTGIRESGRGNSCYVSVSTLADDGDETQTGFSFSVGDSPKEFNLPKAAREAADRATRLLGAVKPPSKRTTVVLDPYVTSQFLGVLSSTLNGENVSKGRSFFADKLGETVADPRITLVDDPTNPLAYTATDIDGEGLAARRNVLIENGVLFVPVRRAL